VWILSGGWVTVLLLGEGSRQLSLHQFVDGEKNEFKIALTNYAEIVPQYQTQHGLSRC
jgi:hypothetical protein